MNKKYKYDAALSFAGEDRTHAELLAEKLKKIGMSVFYDKDHRGHLWGKDQREFEKIYGPESRFVIPFVSQHYRKKEWTQLEFDIAKEEAKKRDTDFILPVRIDNTRLLGLHGDLNYLSLGSVTIDEIAQEFKEKCQSAVDAEVGRGRPRKSPPKASCNVSLLSRKARFALGLIATASLPLTIEHYKQLFPEEKWAVHSKILLQKGLIRKSEDFVFASPEAKRVINGDDNEREELTSKWLTILEELKCHVDAAACLSLHYVNSGRWNEAVNVLADIVEGSDLRNWNELYLTALQSLTNNKVMRRLTVDTRHHLYNSLGICFSQAGRHDDALKWFKKLQNTSRRVGDKNWQGQSHLNSGVSHENLGNHRSAIRAYQIAIKCGKETKDNTLIAGAKGNLAQLLKNTSPDSARLLIQESIELKEELEDKVGIAIAYGQMGNIEASEGNLEEALKWYEASAKISEDQDSLSNLAMSIFNQGNVHYELGRRSRALNLYRRAYRIASTSKCEKIQIQALMGEGRVCFELKRLEESEVAFQHLFDLSELLSDTQNKICSLHGVGVLEILQEKETSGQKNLNRALRLARSHNNVEWMVRCLADRCRIADNGQWSGIELNKLKRTAMNEAKCQNWAVAGELWKIITEYSISRLATSNIIETTYANAVNCFKQAEECFTELLELEAGIYYWHWNSGRYIEAMASLQRMEIVSTSAGLREDAIKAIDERGYCLQELGRYPEAVKLHRKAVRLARKYNKTKLLVMALDNLGEALRELERFPSAIDAFEEAEEVALHAGNNEGAISISHNKALAIQQQGNEKLAADLFIQCRNKALRQKLWHEYTRAWEALGNLAWCQERLSLARKRYSRALAEAKKHKQNEILPRIALHYACLLDLLNETDTAVRELTKHKNKFEDHIDAYVYHSSLAEMCSKVGDTATAKEQWQKGKLSAEQMGNTDYIMICAAGLAEVLETEKAFSEAEEQLQLALSYETDPEGRVALLIQLLRVQLASGNEKQAPQTFDEAIHLSIENDFSDEYIDIYIMLADYEWKGNRASRLNALRAYTVALLHAFEISPETSGEIVAYITNKLTTPVLAPTQKQINSLVKDLVKWTSNELGDEITLVNFATWPFRAVKEMIPFLGKPSQLADKIKQLSSDEEFLFGSSETLT